MKDVTTRCSKSLDIHCKHKKHLVNFHSLVPADNGLMLAARSWTEMQARAHSKALAWHMEQCPMPSCIRRTLMQFCKACNFHTPFIYACGCRKHKNIRFPFTT